MAFWVYILRCADDSYYTGHTDNLEKRIGEHNAGAIASCYTLKRRPLKLVFAQDFSTREEALASERQIKGWSRKKKEAMMRGDWAEVSRLAHSAHPTPVRPDLVEGPVNTANPDPSSPVRPELVEGSVNTANPDPSSPIRPELVEGSVNTANPDPSSPVRPELVEGRPSSPFILRQAQDERTEGGDE